MFGVDVNKSDIRMLLTYILLSAALRVSFVNEELLQHDLAAYLVPAESLLTHFEFLNQSGQPMAFSASLYPFLIAIL